MLKFVVLSCALVASQALFFPPAAGGGGCGCGSPAPACPPPAAPACPPPPPPPQCPVAPSCGGGGAYASPAQSYAPQYAPQAAPGPVFQGVSGGQGYAQAPQAPLPSLSLPFAGQQVQGPQGGSYQQAPGPVGGVQGGQQQQGGQYQQIPQQTFVPQPQEPQEPFVPEAPAAAQGQQYQEQVPQVPQEAPQQQQQQQQQQEYQNQEVHPTEINNEDAAYEDVGQNPGVGEIQEPYPEIETNQESGPYEHAKTKAKAAAAPTIKADPKCNSETLRKLIHENIHEKTSIAKRQIQAKAAAEVGGRIDVICSSGVFSYIVNTELYCETEKNGITCLAFRQAS